jgi:hypothetical protein
MVVVGSLGCFVLGLAVAGSPGTAAGSPGQSGAGGSANSASTFVALTSALPSAQMPPAGNGAAMFDVQQPAVGLTPAPTGAEANAAPLAVALAPPVRPNEVFGTVPYWTLSDASTLDLSGLTTVEFFSLDVNPDGSILTAGTAWDGFLSQNFLELIARAHAAGDRVVLSVSDFSQTSLDELSASPTAPGQLAQSLLLLVKMRDLDGVNLDLEGQGSGDRAGVTNLVKAVSQTLKAANAHYQVTMDTYPTSGADAEGFFDLAALEPFVDAFVVMAYQPNLSASPGGSSPITSGLASLQTTLNDYALTVPPDKVVLSLPLFGYDWPTTNGTLQAQATGSPSVVTDAQLSAAGHPVYWDPVTETAWTSYRTGSQWHEAFFQDLDSFFLVAQMARAQGIAGVGAWALGMDGSNDPEMIAALTGQEPAKQKMPTGPLSKQGSRSALVNPLRFVTSASPTTIAPSISSTSTSSTTSTSTTTTTTTTLPAVSSTAGATFSGEWLGQKTSVIPTAVPPGAQKLVGVISGFTTNYAGLTCLNEDSLLYVFTVAGHAGEDFVIASEATGDCVNAAFVWSTTPSSATA